MHPTSFWLQDRLFYWESEKNVIRSIVVAIVLVITLAWPPLSSASDTRLFLATDDTPGNPWIMGSGSAFHPRSPGIEIELYRRVAARLKLQLEMVRMPWKRCHTEVQQGRVDGIFPASFKPERMALGVYPMRDGQVDPSRKSRDSAYFLYVHKTAPLGWDGKRFVNLDLMDRKTIGVPLGWSIASDLRRMDIDLLEKPRPADLLQILNRGGLAGVVCLDTVTDTYIAQEPNRFTEIRKTYPAVAKKAYYLLLSHPFVSRNPVLAERIWDGIAAIKAEDAFAADMKRYMQ